MYTLLNSFKNVGNLLDFASYWKGEKKSISTMPFGKPFLMGLMPVSMQKD